MAKESTIHIICSENGIEKLELDGDSFAMLGALFYTINKIFRDNNIPQMNRIKATIDFMTYALDFDKTDD